jgi:hypothetical protein
MLGDVLAFQVNRTLWLIVVVVVAVKFTLAMEAPFTDTGAEDGVNEEPGWLGVTVYEPFLRPENV